MARRSGANAVSNLAKSLIDLLSGKDDAAEQMSKYILAKRAAGQANEITDEMMALADPDYLAKNTPLDMSTEARMQRARDMGFDTDTMLYHGAHDEIPSSYQRSDIKAFDDRPSLAPISGSDGTVFMTDNPAVAASYAKVGNQTPNNQIYPLLVKKDVNDPMVDTMSNSYFSIPYKSPTGYNPTKGIYESEENLIDVMPSTFYPDANKKFYTSTDIISRSMPKENLETVTLFNVLDRGPQTPTGTPLDKDVLKRMSSDEIAKLKEYNEAIQDQSRKPSTDVLVQKGDRIRSPFARFDPEFKHLRNLSASVVPASVGMAQLLQKPEVTAEEIEEYLSGLGS